MEDEFTTQSKSCAGSVMGGYSSTLLRPPSYDPRNMVDLQYRYRDAHISDSGWRNEDTDEWVA